MQKAPTVDFNSIALGKDFVVKLCNFYNYFPFSNVFYLGIGLYDYNGNLQEIVSDTPREYLTAWSGYAEYGLKCNIQKKYDNADYMLRFISRMDGYDDWKLVDIEGGSNLNVIPVVIKNGKVYFNQYTTAINDIKSDEHIVRTDYFTLNGQTVTDIDKFRGIVIEKRIYADGTVKTVKRVDRTR